ncbi:hypothetical protein V462_13135 [Pantoea ananatis 15320]|jgi:hypothetical protein|nr:hypothetical protein V462_13135 [Pantoea ananatis 15320]PVY85540.1 hypothetical protein C7427_10385 [Pantoea ananatis]
MRNCGIGLLVPPASRMKKNVNDTTIVTQYIILGQR